jgi:AraC-like DNA-binding protein
LIELNYNNSDFISLLHAMARFFHAEVEENLLRLPASIGKGFFSSFNLRGGLSVMINDCSFNDNMVMHRHASSNQQYFILQFNEPLIYPEETNESSIEQHIYNIRKNTVLLTSSLMDTTFMVPLKVRTRSVRIIFGNDFLNGFVGNEMADKFLSNYFSMLLKNRIYEPLGTDYRVIMDELIKEKIEHPLRMKFIYNRVLLLIEKLVTGFIGKLGKNHQIIKLKDDEISRLIKVESLLVKDYSGTPPTIAALSKVATMSATKLKKDFKAVYGLPIYEYYQKNRMMRAKALLMEGKYAVKEVGMRVGYTNLGHFAASFKKEFGVLPSAMVTGNTTSFRERESAIVS